MDKFDDWTRLNRKNEDDVIVLPPIEVSYSYFCDFTREYVGALMDGTTTTTKEEESTIVIPDIRMMEPNYVKIGDPIYRSTLMFAKSQDKIFGTCPKFGMILNDDNSILPSYIDLVNLSAARIITSASS